MRRLLFTAAILGAATVTASAQDMVINKTDGNYEGGWVVQIPSGSSDYFNVRTDAAGGTGAAGIHVNVADFGSSTPFPYVGITGSNTSLDPTGNTPDLSTTYGDNLGGLSSWLTGSTFVSVNNQFSSSANVSLGAGTHVVLQFPPFDPGLLGVGGDSDTRVRGGDESPGTGSNPFDSSYFTLDGYSTAAAGPTPDDHGMGYLRSAIGGTFLKIHGDPNSGEYNLFTVGAGDTMGFSAFMPNRPGVPTLWLLFISFLGVPLIPIGPVLPSLPYDSNGDATNDWNGLKVTSSWPLGAGNLTINFVCVSGSPGVIGSIQTSNEVTIVSLPDPAPTPWGVNDDGTYESGWVVSIPAGSCDFFSEAYAACPTTTNFTGMSLATMDFGGSVSSYPDCGLAAPNLGLDASGRTPDFSNIYDNGAFPFPALTFVTTSGQMVQNSYGPVDVTGVDTVGFIQFPPFDPGLIGVGSDTTNGGSTTTGWTLDCFSTAANGFSTGYWGLRANN